MRRIPGSRPSGTIVALLLTASIAAGCGRVGDDGTVSLPALQLWPVSDRSATPAASEAQRRIGTAVWGVTPGAIEGDVAPRSRPIRGSAVAVAADALLTSCTGIGSHSTVGIVRRSSFRLARVSGADGDRRLCMLRPAGEELRTAHAYRPFDDLQVGEPLLAVVSRTSRSFTLVRGWLVAKGGSADPFLETTLAVPADTMSAAVFDTYGNLVGFGSPDPLSDSVLVATPVPPASVPRLAAARIGRSPAVLASLAPTPGTPPRSAPILLPVEQGRRGVPDGDASDGPGAAAAERPVDAGAP
jgi:hypothetical protein